MTPVRLPMIAIYIRVSSDYQVEDGFSLDDQLAQCLVKLDEKYGENLYRYEVFVDDGVSGRLGLYDPQHPNRKYRKGLTRLKQAIDEGRIDAVCVHRLDRLSRSYSLLPQLIEEVFGDGEIDFISVRETVLDLTTALGRGFANLLNTSNALYGDIGGQNVKDAHKRRRHLGYPLKPSFGWQWKAEKEADRRRGVEPNPRQAEVVKFVIDEFLRGVGTRSIVKELLRRGHKTATGTDRWSRKLITDILRHPMNYGLVRVAKHEYVQGAHFEQRFFDPEVREKVIGLLAERGSERVFHGSRPEYLLSGLLWCGHCGARIRGRRGRGRRRRYECHGEMWQRTPQCSPNSCRADWVEREVIEEIRGLLHDPRTAQSARREALDMARGARRALTRQRQRLQAELDKLGRKFITWSDQMSDGDITQDEYAEYLADLRTRRADKHEQLRAVEEQLEGPEDFEAMWAAVERALGDVQALWEGMTPAERRELLREIVERVDMFRTEDGGTDLHIKLRVGEPVIKNIPSLRGHTLTPRRMEALWLLGEGNTREQVARRLGQTVAGLAATLRSARLRLGAESLGEAVEMALPIIEPFVRWLDFEGREQRVAGHGSVWPELGTEEQCVLDALAEGLNPRYAQMDRK